MTPRGARWPGGVGVYPTIAIFLELDLTSACSQNYSECRWPVRFSGQTRLRRVHTKILQSSLRRNVRRVRDPVVEERSRDISTVHVTRAAL